MPELPEVETVRRGLERLVVGRSVAAVQVDHARAVRRHEAGAQDFAGLLVGRTLQAAVRRGKYLWLPLDSGDALVAHLGMSGQLLALAAEAPAGPHLRVRVRFADSGPELRFVDQRTFGGLAVQELVRDPAVRGETAVRGNTAVGVGAALVPRGVAHIAPDPLEPAFDDAAFAAALRKRRTGVKRALLDQTLISGIGNIYADEALWRARLHWARPTEALRPIDVRRLLQGVREVLADAIEAGGTSFDALYVNVNGESGWFDRSLDAYGQEGRPCRRCGTPIRRDRWMNRSAYSCSKCQPRPRSLGL